MIAKSGTLRSQPATAGFTLVEVLVCAVLLVIGFVALVAAFGYDSVVAQRGEDVSTATYLADEIHDKALRMAFADVLAMGTSIYYPAILSTGASIGPSAWSQTVTVTQVSAADVNAAGTGAARLTVTVKLRGVPVVTQTYFVFDMSGVPFTDR